MLEQHGVVETAGAKQVGGTEKNVYCFENLREINSTRFVAKLCLIVTTYYSYEVLVK